MRATSSFSPLRSFPAPRHTPFGRAGQAFVELAIALIVLVILIVSATTFATISIEQLRLRRDVRAEAGIDAISRSTFWSADEPPTEETLVSPFSRLNAYARLERFSPALPSHLPSSNYTLAQRALPEKELGLRTTTRQVFVELENFFVDHVYHQTPLVLTESATFPALDGLWRDASSPAGGLAPSAPSDTQMLR